MTESEWLTCDDPRRMLDFLLLEGKDIDRGGGIYGDRRFRLLAIACFRRARDAHGDENNREALELFERHDRGIAVEKAMDIPAMTQILLGFHLHRLPVYTTDRDRHCQWLRDLFRPFGPTPPIDPSWLSWDDGTVLDLARSIDEDRAFDRMPALGDALEDAGCGDAEILRHCRSGCDHVRGCWVVDALLGRRERRRIEPGPGLPPADQPIRQEDTRHHDEGVKDERVAGGSLSLGRILIVIVLLALAAIWAASR